MASIELNPKISSQINDLNLKFLAIIAQQKQEKESFSSRELNQRVQIIISKIKQLNHEEIQQWKNVQQAKIFQLQSKIMNSNQKSGLSQSNGKQEILVKIFKEQIRVFIMVCNKIKSNQRNIQLNIVIKKWRKQLRRYILSNMGKIFLRILQRLDTQHTNFKHYPTSPHHQCLAYVVAGLQINLSMIDRG